MIPRLIVAAAAALTLTSCLEKDQPVALLPPGGLTLAQVTMGPAYDTRIYIDLETGATHAVPTHLYDLAFTVPSGDNRIFLNGANFMKVWRSPGEDFAAVTEATRQALADSVFQPDVPGGAADSLQLQPNTRQVFIVDRGKNRFGSDAAARYRKVQLLSVSETQYLVRWGALQDTAGIITAVSRSGDTDFVYIALEDSGVSVAMEPPGRTWDLVFTRYVHVYASEPLGSPFRNYSVTGPLLNTAAGMAGALIDTELIPFAAMDIRTALDIPLSASADVVGFDWKYYDFEKGYLIRRHQYYLVQDRDQNYYKLRFLDFFTENGEKGAPSFEYQRL